MKIKYANKANDVFFVCLAIKCVIAKYISVRLNVCRKSVSHLVGFNFWHSVSVHAEVTAGYDITLFFAKINLFVSVRLDVCRKSGSHLVLIESSIANFAEFIFAIDP